MTRGDIKTEILVRSGKDTTSAWTSEAFVNDWINQGHRWAAGYKPWPFTEGRISTTYTTATGEFDFEGYKADSFRIITVGGKRLKKTNFEDYLIYKEEEPSGTARIFSDNSGLVLVNVNADVSGTLTAYGQYMPADIGDGDANDSVDTVFSENADEGNQAIIERTLGFLANRDGNKSEANEKFALAQKILDDLWQRVQDEQFKYQAGPKSAGMFERVDVLRGGLTDETNENQF